MSNARLLTGLIISQTDYELRSNQLTNRWKVKSTTYAIKRLLKDVHFFFDDTNPGPSEIYFYSADKTSHFNLPTLKALDLSKLYDTPLDFVEALRESLMRYQLRYGFKGK